jgi:ribonuclease P protein component
VTSQARARFSLARHRLKRADFLRVYRQGRRAQGRTFAVVVLENERDHARLGLSVAKKVARRAVDRNRLRRVLREAFRLERERLPRDLDVVIVATAVGVRVRLVEARAELLELVQRARDKPPRAPKGDAR